MAPGYLRGDEPVVARGVSQKPSAAFRLPGLAPPLCRVALRDRDTESARSNLDTVVIDLEAQKVFLTWRCVTLLRGGAMDVRRIRVTSENAPERRGEASPDNVVHFSRPSAA